MLSSMRNMFKVPDLRNKILFTLLMIAAVPARRPHPGARHRRRRAQDAQGAGRERRRARVPPAVLRRRDHPVRGVRARDHAVHHGVDHHADPRGGDPQARAVAAAGRGRPAQDHPVDPLPHGGHRHHAVDRPHVPLPQRRRRLHRRQPHQHRPVRRQVQLPGRVLLVVLTPHRRHRPAHVDGRAHHPARHRQRHVAADLRLGRQPAPGQLRRRAGRVRHRRR